LSAGVFSAGLRSALLIAYAVIALLATFFISVCHNDVFDFTAKSMPGTGCQFLIVSFQLTIDN
jgi:hypothetical protein